MLCHVLKLRSLVKYWLPVVLWMSLIFAVSGDKKSSLHSSRIIGPIMHWLFPKMTPATVAEVVLYVRKSAHLTEFAVLAALFWFALRKPARKDPRPWSWCTARNAWLLAVACAVSDEFHQHFVPGRTAAILDVVIDATGAAAGLLLLWFIGRRLKFW